MCGPGGGLVVLITRAVGVMYRIGSPRGLGILSMLSGILEGAGGDLKAMDVFGSN